MEGRDRYLKHINIPTRLRARNVPPFRNQSEAGGIKSLDDCKHSSDWPFSSYNKTSTQKQVEGTVKVILEEDPTRYLYSTADRLDPGKRHYRYFQPVYVHAFAAITSAVNGITTNSLTRSGGLPCSGGRLTGTLRVRAAGFSLASSNLDALSHATALQVLYIAC